MILLFITPGIQTNAQAPDWDSVRQAYFDKYRPVDTPAWLFPMVFEEGTGQRDTLYLGYDPGASSLTGFAENRFGER